MKLTKARELLLNLVKTYFSGATVTVTRQSRVPKPEVALVTLTFGNVNRHRDSIRESIDGHTIGSYQSRVSVTIDLFTNGSPVIDDETNAIVAYENTAVDDILAFQDFLGSEYVIDWCDANDVSILVDGDAKDLTGVVNDTNYDYRAQLNVMFYFVQTSVGYASVLGEESIRYPTGEKDENGDPIYSTDKPKVEESVSGDGGAEDTSKPIIIPTFTPTPSGGGSEELGAQELGYFEEAEIKEDTGNG